MPISRPSLLCTLLLLLAVASPAHAWTRTTVEGARAHLDVPRDGELRVTLMVDLRIRGGWLSRFELEGLDADLVLDPDKPVWLVSQDGEKYRPTAEARGDGRVRVTFPNRKVAPWRGDYELGLRYTTRAPVSEAARAGGERLRVRWTLPSWPSGLRDVWIEVNAPAGSEAVPDPEGAHVVMNRARAVGDRRVLTWERFGLPRTVAWQVALDVPASAFASEVVPGARPALRSSRPLAPREAGLLPLLGLWLLALCLGKRLLTALRARREGLRAIPLFPVPDGMLRFGLLSLACVGGGLVASAQPLVGLSMQALGVALALDRRLERAVPHPAGRRPADAGALRRARTARWAQHLDFGAWLDATTALGATGLATAWGVVMLLDPGRGLGAALGKTLLLATPLWFTATRLHGPPSVEMNLRRLERLRRTLTAEASSVGAELSLQLRVAAQRVPRAAELSVCMPDAAEGLRACTLVVADADWLDAQRSIPCWRLVAREGSAAARAIEGALEGNRRSRLRADGDRVWLAGCVDAPTELRALHAWLEGERATSAKAA